MEIPDSLREYDRIGSDPSVMTIERQVARGFIVLPSFSSHIPLLTGFSSSEAIRQEGQPFITDTSPFVNASVVSQKLRYWHSDICRGTFLSNVSTKKSRISEHLSVHLGVTVGCRILSGGVSGSYDKKLLELSDSLTVSQRCSFRCGTLSLSSSSSLLLTTEARQLLRGNGGLAAFEKRYGDFFLARVSVGADAGACLTMSSFSHNDDEDKYIVGEVKFLFWSKQKEIANSHDRHSLGQRKISLVAHDTLGNKFVSTTWSDGLSEEDTGVLGQTIGDYTDKAASLDQRVNSRVGKWPELSVNGATVDWKLCRELWDAGLVAEMVLVPFTSLREVQELLSKQDSQPDDVLS